MVICGLYGDFSIYIYITYMKQGPPIHTMNFNAASVMATNWRPELDIMAVRQGTETHNSQL